MQIFMRYVHIVSAVAAVGGLVFLSVCLLPATRLLDEGFSDKWMTMIRQRFHRVVWISIGGLIVSGTYNWVLLAKVYKEMGPVGGAIIGTKVLLAMILFTVVWLGSSGILKPKAAQMINIHLAAINILLASVLRHYRLEHLQSLIGS